MKRKIQACKFKSGTKVDWQPGLAFLNGDFDFYEVDFIVDTEGNKIIAVAEYVLSQSPIGAAIDFAVCDL